MGLPMALTVVGGLFSAASSVMAGQAQARAYEAEAKMAEYNARMAERQGVEALKEERFRQQARQFQSSQRTTAAASGTQVSGSALSVLADTAMGIEQDADTIRFNTLKDKWGFDVQRTNFTNQASAARASAKNARTAGWRLHFAARDGGADRGRAPRGAADRTGLQAAAELECRTQARKRRVRVLMDILDAFFDLDASVARAEMRRIVDEARRSSGRRRAAFNRTWRWPQWNDTDLR